MNAKEMIEYSTPVLMTLMFLIVWLLAFILDKLTKILKKMGE